MSETDIAEQVLRMELMRAQMGKIEFDIEAERRRYDAIEKHYSEEQKHREHLLRWEFWKALFTVAGLVIAAFAAGHFVR
jgi:hypothetical protein